RHRRGGERGDRHRVLLGSRATAEKPRSRDHGPASVPTTDRPRTSPQNPCGVPRDGRTPERPPHRVREARRSGGGLGRAGGEGAEEGGAEEGHLVGVAGQGGAAAGRQVRRGGQGLLGGGLADQRFGDLVGQAGGGSRRVVRRRVTWSALAGKGARRAVARSAAAARVSSVAGLPASASATSGRRRGVRATAPTATAAVATASPSRVRRAAASARGHSAISRPVARRYAARSPGVGAGMTTVRRISPGSRRWSRVGSPPSPYRSAMPSGARPWTSAVAP